jgi:hypothetical protein
LNSELLAIAITGISINLKKIKKKMAFDGLGDVVKKVTEITGISYIANVISNGDPKIECSPCEERRKLMNQKFPFKK